MSGCGKDHHYLIHPGENVYGNSAETTHHNTFESGGSTNNMQQPVTEHQSNQARTIVTKALPLRLASLQGQVPTVLRQFVPLAASRPRVCFNVVPVKISCEGGTKQITTCAFLDGGSSATFCLESLVQELGLKDIRPTSFTMMTANHEKERSGYEVQLNIESLEGDVKFQISYVLTTPNLPVTRRHVATEEDLRRWLNFYDDSLPDTGDGRVTILIGRDCPDIIDKREGQHGEPIVIKTGGPSMVPLVMLLKVV